MNKYSKFTLIGVVVLAVILIANLKIIKQNEFGLILRFGKIVNIIKTPGLYWKLPYPIHECIVFDKRIHTYDTQQTELLTKDQKNIIMLTFVTWKIDDPVRYYNSVGGNIETFQTKLDSLVNNTKNLVLGEYSYSDLFVADQGPNKLGEIGRKIYLNVKESAASLYGIHITYIGIKRLTIPKENIRAVFNQMRADRNVIANKYIAEGEIQAARIRAHAELEGAKMVSEAKRKASKIRGQADAEAAKIYASAYSKSPAFYETLRSLETLKKVTGKSTSLILGTDKPPFDLFIEKPEVTPNP